MINIHYFTFNPFQENTYILFDETKACVIIDPGCYEREEKNVLEEFITDKDLTPVKLLNTHCHLDHIFGNYFVANTWSLDLEMHRDDVPTLELAPKSAMLYGIPNVDLSPAPSVFLEDGDTVRFGDSELEVIFTPGHAPGHVVFVDHDRKAVIGGDVLFYGSIGRTDLPGGDHDTLIGSIRSRVLTLGDDYKVYPGHGPATSTGFEKKHNPFLQS